MTGVPRRWFASDYDYIEHLCEKYPLPPSRMGRLLDPPVSGKVLHHAMHAAGIEPPVRGRGMPGARAAHWEAIVEAALACPEERALREESARRRVESMAAEWGFEITGMRRLDGWPRT